MNALPLVTIAIPAFNPRFFRAALESALGQRYDNFEIVVCDDSGAEGIKAIVDSIAVATQQPLRYYRNDRTLGFGENVLSCLGHASGELIKFLCDDDVLKPNCLAEQVDALVKLPEASICVVKRVYQDADGFVMPARLENSTFYPASSLFKGQDLLDTFERSPFNILGGFSGALMRRLDVAQYLPALVESGFTAQLDFALYVCLLRRGELVALDSLLAIERLHPGRLRLQRAVIASAAVEEKWLAQMLRARSGDAPPASGWVRFVLLATRHNDPDWQWDELDMKTVLPHRSNTCREQIGSDCESQQAVYEQWLSCRVLTDTQRDLLPMRMAAWGEKPQILPVVHQGGGGAEDLSLTLESLRAQTYPGLPPLVVDVDSEQLFTQIDDALTENPQAQWFYLLRAGDRLRPDALLILAERIAASGSASVVYSDEGVIAGGLSCDPTFKPDFNLDLMRSYPYVGRVLLFKRETWAAAGGFDPHFGPLAPHDLLWKCVESIGPHAVEHISEVLVESSFAIADWLKSASVVAQGMAVTSAHLQRIGVEHAIAPLADGVLDRVRYVHPHQPLVSIVLAIKDHVGYMQACVEAILQQTRYPNLELLLVDQGSEVQEARSWFAAMGQLASHRVRVIECAGRDYADLRNQAASQAHGEFILFMDTRVRVIDGAWLDELMAHAQRAEVGVVGPKLVSEAGLIVQGGMILGLNGAAGVAFQGQPAGNPGYMDRLQVTQNWSAVGDECVLVRREAFCEAGGLNEASVLPQFTLVDLCLRIKQLGYLIVWTPQACLQVAEPKVLGFTAQSTGHDQLLDTWLPAIARDPAFNVNLSASHSDFVFSAGRRTGWDPFVQRFAPKVLAMPINNTAVGHYRVTEPFKELEKAGRIQGYTTFESPSFLELERARPDVIISQCRYSKHTVDVLESIRRFSGALRIFELDDYVVQPSAKNDHARRASPERERWLRATVATCDRLVVSTQPLAEALYGMCDDIRVVPNLLAPKMWQSLASQRGADRKPRVGWGGGTSHRGDLEIIAEVVRELADEVHWVFFGMCPEQLKPYIHEYVSPVGLAAYPQKLASLNLDLALAPLEQSLFNDCKSNLRLLEYGACGYPVIATQTRAYEGALPHTSIQGNTTREWVDAIRMHLSDPAASYALGDSLKGMVLRDFMLRGDNLNHWANGWLPD